MDHSLYPNGRSPAVVALAGDWHGNTAWAVRMIEKVATETAAKLIVHLGDFGLLADGPIDNQVHLPAEASRLINYSSPTREITTSSAGHVHTAAAPRVDTFIGWLFG